MGMPELIVLVIPVKHGSTTINDNEENEMIANPNFQKPNLT